MKAVVEYWTTGVRQYSSEYWIIVRNAFGYNGLGVSLSRVVVVGATIPKGQDSEGRYQYTFLWILDPKASHTLGVTSRYLAEHRQAMNNLFRLVKVELVFDQTDVDDLERSMLKAHEGFPEVLFVEEFFYSPDSLSKLDRKMRFNRGLQTPPSEEPVVERRELEPPPRFLTVPDKQMLSVDTVVPSVKVQKPSSSKLVSPVRKSSSNKLASPVEVPKVSKKVTRPVSVYKGEEYYDDDIAG
ncbi:hypothetical protein N7499_002190 [Penicillium canescens]|nr:hypothetical protein N7499_002190 [Penicillium canescens]KAJ6165805.1 hypothetical protein N7485_009049 [Penicillium canescens]